jgi:phosphohistidine phosphatase
MDLWLVRHGEAVHEKTDPQRPLSPEGERAIAAKGAFLADLAPSFDLVAASRKKRARQTAEILGSAFGLPRDAVVETEALLPSAAPEAFLAFLEEHMDKESVLCAGHLPSIGSIASFLVSSGDPVRIVFEAGTVCRIRLGEIRRGGGELLILI